MWHINLLSMSRNSVFLTNATIHMRHVWGHDLILSWGSSITFSYLYLHGTGFLSSWQLFSLSRNSPLTNATISMRHSQGRPFFLSWAVDCIQPVKKCSILNKREDSFASYWRPSFSAYLEQFTLSSCTSPISHPYLLYDPNNTSSGFILWRARRGVDVAW
jgi:hypothetical protein